MLINVDGELPNGVTAKDLILFIIGKIGTDGGTGYSIEFGGSAIRSLSMEGRMTVCNMSIEAGGRAGMIAPDETTYEYLKGRPHCPKGRNFDKAIEKWDQYKSDPDAEFEKRFSFYYDYPGSSQLIGSQKDTAVDEIFERITQDVFNASLAKW